jgi:hypothetical protein
MSADWSLWGDIPHTELWRAVALSMDIEPTKLPGYERSCVRDPFLNYPFHKCPEEFKRRLEIAIKHLGHKLPVWLFHEPLWTSEVEMIEIRKWTASLNSPWSIPKKFPQIKSAKGRSNKGDLSEKLVNDPEALKRLSSSVVKSSPIESQKNKLDGRFVQPNRTNALTTLITLAQQSHPTETSAAQVFAVLQAWASESKPPPPLIGVTPQGIQWRTPKDDVSELSLHNLRDRLRRKSAKASN